MYCINFYINPKKTKTAKLMCDKIDKSDSEVWIAERTFDYPSFIKHVEWALRTESIESFYELE